MLPIASDDYFSFIVPATIMMILGLRIPLGDNGRGAGNAHQPAHAKVAAGGGK